MTGQLAQLKADAKAEGWSEWIKSEADERAVLDGCWFDVRAASKVVRFFEECIVHTMGPLRGKPFLLLDWEKNDLTMPLFGWKRDRQRPHLRRYSKADVFVAKKQGKSTWSGGVANYFIMAGGHRAEIYGVAHTREQAGIIYREAAAMARRSPKLKKRLKVIDSTKRIIYPETDSFYHALAGENNARGVEGINPLLILFDEIHVQRSRDFYDALAYASAARENSLMLSVSTVGVEDHTTIWWEQYQYAKGIISGTIQDNSRFAYIAQADEGCKTSPEMRADPVQWRKAMPSLGHTVTEEKVAEAVREAENAPAKLNNLLRYVFNIPTAQVECVIPMDQWNACEYAGEFPDLKGRVCFGGLDAASKEDLTALVLYFLPVDGEDRGWLRSWFWCPEDKVREREQRQMFHYTQWVKDGWLLTTPGARIEHGTVLDFVEQCEQDYQIEELAYDKWNADAIVGPLELNGHTLVEISQGFDGMSENCHAFLTAIASGAFWHDGNPVMTWCCQNTAAEILEDKLRFSKKKSPEKIDGTIAGAMAVGRATLHHEDNSPSLIILK